MIIPKKSLKSLRHKWQKIVLSKESVTRRKIFCQSFYSWLRRKVDGLPGKIYVWKAVWIFTGKIFTVEGMVLATAKAFFLCVIC